MSPSDAGLEGWQVTQWTSRDGLPQNSVTSIVQTPDGYLWLGTFGGLARFDGEQFVVTRVEDGDGFLENRIVSMHVDRAGDLWLGLMARGVVRIREGVIEPAGNQVPSGPVWRIAEDRQGAVWKAGPGLSRWDGDGFRAEPIVGNATTWSIVADPVDGIWAATSRGVVRVDSQGARVIDLGIRVTADQWWFIGLKPLDHPWLIGGPGFIEIQENAPGNVLALDEDRPRVVRTSLVDRSGRWWFGAENGLFLADPSPTAAPAFGRVQAPFGHVRTLFEDADGTIWVGTDGDGLFRLRRPAHTAIPYSEILSRSGRRLRLAGDAEGLWYCRGAPRPMAVRLTGAGTGAPIELERHGVQQIYAALSSADGSLWISTGGAIVRFRGHEVERLTHELPSAITSLIEFDGTILCGGKEFVARLEDGSFHIIATPRGTVQRFAAGAGGDVWFITPNTLYRLGEDSLTDYGEFARIPASLRALAVAPNGDVWIGSYGGGLMRFRGRDATRLTTTNGIPDDAVSYLSVDENGTSWAHSNRGVFRLQAAEVEAFVAGESDRVRCRVFDTGEAHGAQGWHAADGDLVLPTLNGLVRMNTRQQPALAPVGARIDAIESGIRRHDVSAGIALEPGERDLRIGFSAVALAHSDQLRFRYRWADDETWLDAGRSREVVVNGLSPGQHRFEVAACVGDGLWVVATKRFSVAPLFHETGWFRGFAALTILGAVIAGMRWRLAWSERRRVKLSRQLVQADEQQRRRIGRELHDDISQRLAAVAMEASLAEGADGPARVTTTLQRLASDVDRLSRQLHPSILQDLGLARAIESECRVFQKRTGIATRIRLCDPVPVLSDDVGLTLFRVLQESLRNVEKHARAASVEIELEQHDDRLTLRVTDTGRGFETARRNGGLGLVSMRERAQLVGGHSRVRSRPGQGTTVEVEVPCQQPDRRNAGA